ncbi:uncharacterized protein EV420DRAFT_1635087 [Desarmillaria tabescens]|uniref:Uncharacterized protein n=1 Tax=Armillaria tabescens TaxID=1929756 RepID=A0AA39NLF8_ARMTA|nr:uncharacterized protein EV420DRAFT_1635087 [Desarmillaria tabescens]KAK0467815.1 hypothetical protein EV420DRAFT_1635087 [Desarmillaria tabescens]
MPPIRSRDRLFPSMHTVLRQADSLPASATIYYQHVPLPSFVFRYEPYGHEYFNRNHPLMTTTHDGDIDWDECVYFTVALPTKGELALDEAPLEPEPPRDPVRRPRISVLVILLLSLAVFTSLVWDKIQPDTKKVCRGCPTLA